MRHKKVIGGVTLIAVLIIALFAATPIEASYTRLYGSVVGDADWNANPIKDAYIDNASLWNAYVPTANSTILTVVDTSTTWNTKYNKTDTIANVSLPMSTVINRTTYALDTAYTSEAGRPTMVFVVANFSVNATSGSKAIIAGYTGATRVSGNVGIEAGVGVAQSNEQLMFIVPANTVYFVNSTTAIGGVVTLRDWRTVLMD